MPSMSPGRARLTVSALSLLLVISPLACRSKPEAAPGDAAPEPSPSAPATDGAKKPLGAFSSDDEIVKYYKDYQDAQAKKREAQAKRRRDQIAKASPGPAQNGAAPPPPSPVAAAAPAAEAAKADSFADSKADKAADGITNNQVAGVDEGGIVKVHGDHLVILRRGRLFTVRVDDKQLRPVAAIDAFGPGIDPQGTWYDEMLVSGNTLVVIGYSYARGGTEVGVFDLDSVGGIAYRATYHLRGNDYYSARNYASRVVGGKLVFYTPSYLSPATGPDFFARFPAVRKWHAGATAAEFKRVVPAASVFKPAFDLAPQALHTVTTCDLTSPELACKATSILGPAGRVFYVSEAAVYVWMTEHTWDDEGRRQTSAVVRLPLDGSAPGAVKVSGGPIDQFSFTEQDGHLSVFVRAETHGDGMWGAGASAGDVGVVRLPLGFFREGSIESTARNYTRLEGPKGYAIQNRFVGNVLLYGSQSFGYRASPLPGERSVFVHTLGQKASTAVDVGHSIDRLEALGSNAIVVGQREKDLLFTSLSLTAAPKVASTYTRAGASQAEQRSHGFFYKPDSVDTGLLGLPILGSPSPGDDGRGDQGSAKVLFLKNQSLDLSPVGELVSSRVGPANDGCRASCVDWYGNARPIFFRGRIFALMGYEIVEGALDSGKIKEIGRTTYAPKALPRRAD